MVLLRIFVLGRDTNTCAYIKRRLAMCARKLGRVKEAVKLMKEVFKNPLASDAEPVHSIIICKNFGNHCYRVLLQNTKQR
jgi:hypothetical protein